MSSFIERGHDNITLAGLCQRAAVVVAIFGLLNLCLNATLWKFLPDPLRPFWKVTVVAENPEINVLFLGSSHIHRAVIPPIFDNALGFSGLHSFNMADDGQSMLESFANAEDLFGMESNSVKFVFFEPLLFSTLLRREPNRLRTIRYYSLEHAIWAIEEGDPLVDESLGSSLIRHAPEIIVPLVRHYVRYGLGTVEPELAHPPGFSDWARGFPDNDGFTHLVRAITPHPREPVANPDAVSQRQFRLILSFASYIASHGAVPIVLKAPELNAFTSDVIGRLDRDCGRQLPLRFDLSSPRKFPELWRPENRLDDDHLNMDGAMLFSPLLAKKLRKAIDDGSVAAPLCKGPSRQ